MTQAFIYSFINQVVAFKHGVANTSMAIAYEAKYLENTGKCNPDNREALLELKGDCQGLIKVLEGLIEEIGVVTLKGGLSAQN